jgi:hypothetical protein
MWWCPVVLAGTQAVCTVHTACVPAPHDHSQHKRATPHALLNSLVLLTMGIMMPEICWELINQGNKHQIIVTPSWFYYLPTWEYDFFLSRSRISAFFLSPIDNFLEYAGCRFNWAAADFVFLLLFNTTICNFPESRMFWKRRCRACICLLWQF